MFTKVLNLAIEFLEIRVKIADANDVLNERSSKIEGSNGVAALNKKKVGK